MAWKVKGVMKSLVNGEDVMRGVTFSTGAQLGARFLHFGLNVVSSLALIRYLGPTTYGDYVLIVTVIALLGLVSDFGLNNVAIREIIKGPRQERRILGTVVSTRICLAILAAGAAQLILIALGASAEMQEAGAVLSCVLGIEALLAVVVTFHVRLKQQYEAIVRVSGELVETTMVLVLIAHHAELDQLVAAPVVGGIVAVSLALAIAGRKTVLSFLPDLGRLKPMLREAAPVGITLILATVYLQVGRFLLIAWGTRHDVGIYGAAYQGIEYVLLASAVLINVLYPVLVRFQIEDRPRAVGVYRRGSEALVAAILPIPVVLLTLGHDVVPAVYGDRFAEATAPLAILSCGLVFMVSTVWHGFTLLSVGLQRVTLIYQAFGLTLMVVVNVILVPRYGPVGAAIATTTTAIALAFISAFAVARFATATLERRPLSRIVGANAALAATILVVRTVTGSTAAALCCLMAYPVWLLAAGVFHPEAVHRLLLALRRGDEVRVAG
jgi:O-antigen/teichoic acid export membrane protein